MKSKYNYLVLFLAFGFFNSGIAQYNFADIENSKMFNQNKEEPHATLMPFDIAEGVIENNWEKSPYYQSLNRTWKFHRVKTRQSALKNFINLNLTPMTGIISLYLQTGNWKIMAEDKTVTQDTLSDFNIQPGESKVVTIPIPKELNKPGMKYFINFSVTTTTEKSLVPKGYEIASEQIKLSFFYKKWEKQISLTFHLLS